MENKNYSKVKRMYPITAVCKDCGQEFTISVKEQLFAQENKGFNLPKRCPDCRNARKNITKQIVCMECGEVFEFTAHEQEFYKKNGFVEPKRCKTCRKVRKENTDGQDIAEENK
jgi:predicted RNA-binding Zn-ribbon protein involved in translation (DUF1610 family)